jgi:hypothetical protein
VGEVVTGRVEQVDRHQALASPYGVHPKEGLEAVTGLGEIDLGGEQHGRRRQGQALVSGAQDQRGGQVPAGGAAPHHDLVRRMVL